MCQITCMPFRFEIGRKEGIRGIEVEPSYYALAIPPSREKLAQQMVVHIRSFASLKLFDQLGLIGPLAQMHHGHHA